MSCVDIEFRDTETDRHLPHGHMTTEDVNRLTNPVCGAGAASVSVEEEFTHNANTLRNLYFEFILRLFFNT